MKKMQKEAEKEKKRRTQDPFYLGAKKQDDTVMLEAEEVENIPVFRLSDDEGEKKKKKKKKKKYSSDEEEDEDIPPPSPADSAPSFTVDMGYEMPDGGDDEDEEGETDDKDELAARLNVDISKPLKSSEVLPTIKSYERKSRYEVEEEERRKKKKDKKDKKKDKKKKPEPDDDAKSMMSDITMDTLATGQEPEEPAKELTEEEKKEWEKEGKSELDRKYFGIFSRSRHGRYHECERILKSEVDKDVRDEFGNTPLIVACQNGKKRVAKLFLRYKANINTVNKQGNTCLHYCFTYGYGDLGDYLISKGADQSIKNHNGLTCYEGLDKERQASAITSARSSKRR
mmetsp:Transcript_3239/g.5213  ORF Transcript_3239/g.5213 Transcript_3239/m.5213 type:complete len:342 (+) Transcript_3239:153-1178(+)